ncbi:MAG: hypothetical protein ACRD1Y_03805 [Terriglobales bacterium]
MEKPAKYNIRGEPAEVDRILRRRTRERDQSLNQLAIEELIAATQRTRQRADFTDLVGRWSKDPGFDALVAEQPQTDWKMWR